MRERFRGRWPKNVEIIPSYQAVKSMADVNYSPYNLETFLRGSCETIRIGKTDVVIVRQEDPHEGVFLPNALVALANAPGTKAVMVEYFRSEVTANARRFPVIGRLLAKRSEKSPSLHHKTIVSEKLATVAKQTRKPIVVADIANKPEYYYGHIGVPYAAVIASGFYPKLMFISIPFLAMRFFNRIQDYVDKGFFDRRQIHRYERFMLDTEDARRVFAARGIQQLAKEYESTNGQPSRILVCYPEAHTRRIANYLTDTKRLSRMSRAVKNRLYRLIPKAEISVRQYIWGGDRSITPHPAQPGRRKRREAKEDLQGWVRISNKRI